MNKRSISKLLIFLIFTSFGVIKAYGETTAEQSVMTDVQPAVAIDKAASNDNTTITDAVNGIHSGLQSVFNIQTNGATDYEFIMSAKTLVDGSYVSAYMPYQSGAAILFARINNSESSISSYPTQSDVNDAKANGNNNRNIIAYPVDLFLSDTSAMQSELKSGYKDYEECFVIDMTNTEGTVTHSVQGTPVQGTYSVAQDQSGTYQAIITITAVSK